MKLMHNQNWQNTLQTLRRDRDNTFGSADANKIVLPGMSSRQPSKTSMDSSVFRSTPIYALLTHGIRGKLELYLSPSRNPTRKSSSDAPSSRVRKENFFYKSSL
ncbi:MAG: hypothetical protein CVU43_03735 [Chloroflexi bacterium HGW-Chloroflexi-5]|jgi:hypothetical protein|nr:MAG: hypothetical protein CVU43_03735 [Chloroflexi bacterium HGW-Chloroflexi-5]